MRAHPCWPNAKAEREYPVRLRLHRPNDKAEVTRSSDPIRVHARWPDASFRPTHHQSNSKARHDSGHQSAFVTHTKHTSEHSSRQFEAKAANPKAIVPVIRSGRALRLDLHVPVVVSTRKLDNRKCYPTCRPRPAIFTCIPSGPSSFYKGA